MNNQNLQKKPFYTKKRFIIPIAGIAIFFWFATWGKIFSNVSQGFESGISSTTDKEQKATATNIVNVETPSATITTPAISKSTEIIEAKNTSVKFKNNATYVYGELTNNDKKEHSISLQVVFYDENNAIMGISSAFIKLNAIETKTFEAISTENYKGYKTYKVQFKDIY